MFLATLIGAGIQLVAAVAVFQIARNRAVERFFVALAVGLLGAFLLAAMSASPAVFLQGVVLLVIGVVCTFARARQSVFLGSALAGSLAAIGIVGQANVHSWARHRERYSFESMSARLAYEANAVRPRQVSPKATALSPVLPVSTLNRLDRAEEWRSWSRRSYALRLVHASYTEQFVTSPGFGVGRMIRLSPAMIERGGRRGRQTRPLDRRPDFEGSPVPGALPVEAVGELEATMSSIRGPLGALHDEARRDFLDPDGFGYVRDREHVAGFEPHSFYRNEPRLIAGESRLRWLTVRVELVSLLKHERPMVYVSERLPNMTELREAPVRELDAFEQRALASLIQGEDLVSDAQPGRVRALGSLRAMRQCLECHEVQRGTLLGAFSYEFLSDPPVRQPKKDPSADADELL